MQHFNEAKIGEIAVKPSGRPLAGLLDGMDRKFQRNAACRPDALANPFGQHQMVPITG